MKRLFLVAAAASTVGCSFGVGSAFVGQWRPHDRVDVDACLMDEAGQCAERKQVTTHVPERAFWGVLVAYPAVGIARVSRGDGDTTKARLAPSLEVMTGKGRYAVGARVAAQIELDAARATPIAVLGHLSLTERLSVHAGAGYLPYARLHGESAFVGAEALGGFQLALSRTRSETYLVATVEGDVTWIGFDQPYRAIGLTGHLGIFF